MSETYCRVARASNGQDSYLPSDKHKVLYMDSFAYNGAIIWNNLIPSICNCSNLNQFKSAYFNVYCSYYRTLTNCFNTFMFLYF